jgi:hypothetical protein
VARHRGRVDARNEGDGRHRAVPEGEGIARVEAAVAELVHRPQRGEVVEVHELPFAREVEQPVASDRAGARPDDRCEREPDEAHGREDEQVGLVELHARGHRRRQERCERRHCQEDERERQAAADGERDHEGGEQERQAPQDRGGDTDARLVRPSDRAQDQRAGNDEHARDGDAEAEPQTEALRGQQPDDEHGQR